MAKEKVSLPSWDDALANTPLNIGNLLDTVRKVLASLPPDAKPELIDEAVSGRIQQAFSPENLAAVRANLAASLIRFALTGKGPVQKSASDLVG